MQVLTIKKLPLFSPSLQLDSTLVGGNVLFSVCSLSPISGVTADPDVKLKDEKVLQNSVPCSGQFKLP